LTRICHAPAKKPYEFIRTIARITLLMQLDELLHPNRHKTHYATPFPIGKTDAWLQPFTSIPTGHSLETRDRNPPTPGPIGQHMFDDRSNFCLHIRISSVLHLD
jgi:hypothetical protein